MLTAYCDESGKHDQASHFLIGGLRANVKTWSKMEHAWRIALRRFGLSAMHASDCESGYGEFEDKSREDRDEIQRAFIRIVSDTPCLGFCLAIPRSLFDFAVSPVTSKRYKKHPYFFIFQGFVGTMALNRHALPRRGKVDFIFDRQKEFGGTAKQWFDFVKDHEESESATRFGAISFGDKKDFLPLQAADLFAYESYKFTTEALRAGRVRLRWQTRTLIGPGVKRGLFDLRIWERGSLETLHESHYRELTT